MINITNKHLVTSNKKFNRIYTGSFASAFYFFGFMTLIVYSLYHLSNILTPIAISILVWFLINALATFIKKLPYFDSNFGEFISIPLSLVIIFITTFTIGEFIASSIGEIASSVNLIDEKLQTILSKLSTFTSYDLSAPIKDLIKQFNISVIINKSIAAFSNIFGNFLQILLYVLFLLADQKFFNQKINALFLKYENRTKTLTILTSISKNIKTYLLITTFVSIITGTLTTIICMFFDLKGAILWGFIAFILNFIPTIGSIIAVFLPIAYSLIQFTDFFNVFMLLVCLGIVQFAIGNLLAPRLLGDKLNISQFVVILSLVVWGAMWGTTGMFLSVPLMMILMIILSQFKNTRPIAILISGNGKISNM